MPSSRGSSRPRDQTCVSCGFCTAGGFFTLEPLGKPKVKVKVAQSYLTHCDTVDYTVHGFLQASILEWLPFPSPGDPPNPEIEPRSLASQADSWSAEPQGKPLKDENGSKCERRGKERKFNGPRKREIVTGKRTWKNVVLRSQDLRLCPWLTELSMSRKRYAFLWLKHHCPRFYYQSQDSDVKILTD